MGGTVERLVFTHAMLMHVLCLTFKNFGWFYYSRCNKAQFDTYIPYLKYPNVNHSERLTSP